MTRHVPPLQRLAVTIRRLPLVTMSHDRQQLGNDRHRAADRSLRAHDGLAPRCAAVRRSGGRCSRCSPGSCRAAGGTAWSRERAGSCGRSRGSGSPADDIDFLRGAGVIDEDTADFLAAYRFGGNIWGYAEGDCYFPGSPILVVDGDVRRSGGARDDRVVDLQPRLRCGLSGLADGDRGRRTADYRDGIAPHARTRGGGCRTRRIPGRLRGHVEPAGRIRVRRADGGHQRARVHDGP